MGLVRVGAPLPIPGLVWGRYPQRAESGPPRPLWPSAAARDASGPQVARMLKGVRAAQAKWHALDGAERPERLLALRARLARDGWGGALQPEALGCVADAGGRALGRNPFDTQLRAASVLLADQLAEMATGEGKTYAAALAAGVAALAGVPVHVLTANDYLVQRDAAQLRAFYARLGLSVGAVLGTSSPDERRAAYACDVVYATAREVAFDYLRDGLAGSANPAPLLRGLCMAVLDEADSLLIDEAGMPLLLAQADEDPQQRAACFQALALARQMRARVDMTIGTPLGAEGAAVDPVVWTEVGLAHLDTLCENLGGAWLNRRHRQDMVSSALVALHLLRREHHYLVREGRVELLDAQTGRVGPGRVWSNGLQTLVELKEGVTPSPATTPSARISFQRFFARYVRLCGMSGTLSECRGELARLYRRTVVVVPLRLASRRNSLDERLFIDAWHRRQAVVQRVTRLQARGQPVLVGTDSVAESELLSQLLALALVPHRMLNARHDAAEADIIARAGQVGAVTVATQMAGRGTDIALGPGAAALGGLHVLCCHDAANSRLERQLIGRCARQGDPGSAEVWRHLQAPGLASSRISSLVRWGRKTDSGGAVGLGPAWVRHWAAWVARAQERRNTRQRRRVFEQEVEWQRRLNP